MYFNRDYRAILKRGRWLDRNMPASQQNEAGVILAVCLLGAGLLIAIALCF